MRVGFHTQLMQLADKEKKGPQDLRQIFLAYTPEIQQTNYLDAFSCRVQG
jgi:hypothetical protein